MLKSLVILALAQNQVKDNPYKKNLSDGAWSRTGQGDVRFVVYFALFWLSIIGILVSFLAALFAVQVRWEAPGRSRHGWRSPIASCRVGPARPQSTRTGMKPPPKPASPGDDILSPNRHWGWRTSASCKWQLCRGVPQVAGRPPAAGPAATALLYWQQGTPSSQPACPAQEGCLAE